MQHPADAGVGTLRQDFAPEQPGQEVGIQLPQPFQIRTVLLPDVAPQLGRPAKPGLKLLKGYQLLKG